MKAKSIAYQNSELAPQSNELIFPKTGLWNWMERVGKSLIQALEQRDELKIRQVIDRHGDTYWEVRDPIRKHTLWFYSEAEVRAWLDRRFG